MYCDSSRSATHDIDIQYVLVWSRKKNMAFSGISIFFSSLAALNLNARF